MSDVLGSEVERERRKDKVVCTVRETSYHHSALALAV